MKYVLIITGAVAALAIMAPELVVFGYLLLIVPGLILTIAPTVFVYLAVTAVVRRLLPIDSPLTATAIAFGVALLLGWAVMQPFRTAALAAYRADELPDLLPDEAIQLYGHVRIERLDQRGAAECDYLSLALLDSPHVQSLTTVTAGGGRMSDGQRIAAYALVDAKADPGAGLFPSDPGRIVLEYAALVQTNRGDQRMIAAKAVEANWAMRLADQERLREVNPVEADAADWVIRVDSRANYHTGTLRRITILDSKGTVRFRNSYRKQAVPARMFYLGFRANLSGGPVSAFFHVGRQVMESGDRSLKPESRLLETIRYSAARCDAQIVNLLRDQAVQALDDSAASPVRIDLARRYLGLFFFDAKPQDHALIARIVADDRVKDIDSQIRNVFSKDKTPVVMKNAYVDRIGMDHTSAGLRHHLAEALARFPSGSFTNPSLQYLAIWDSPEIYQQAAPLIATLADLGPDQALPKLDKLLDTAVGLPHWSDRRSMVHGIREALIRLGPQASSAAPRIQALYLRRPSPIMHNAGDAGQWRFALARMGVALEDLPVFSGQSHQSVDQNLRRVAEQLRRYEQQNASQESI